MKKKIINDRVFELCKLTGYYNNRTKAIEFAAPTFIRLDYFGGKYILRGVNTESGTVDKPFGLVNNVCSPKEMETLLLSLIAGIKYGREHAA